MIEKPILGKQQKSHTDYSYVLLVKYEKTFHIEAPGREKVSMNLPV